MRREENQLPEEYYSENYLKISCNSYPPHNKWRKYIRGGSYVLNGEYRKQIIRELGDSAFILMDYYYSKITYKYFKPDDNERIGEELGWNNKKVERVRKKLKDSNYLLVTKETGRNSGKVYYTVLLGQEIVKHFKETGNILNPEALIVDGITPKAHHFPSNEVELAEYNKYEESKWRR